jgi:hypothetical protein
MLYPKINTLFERDEKTFKVDENKIKDPKYSLIKEWEFTEKIDGTNIRIIFDDDKNVKFGGRTDNAQLPSNLLNFLHKNISSEQLSQVFPEGNIVIYGEGYGGKIQNGSGYSRDQKFIAFDILVDERWWLSRENVENICERLKLDIVPLIGHMTLEEGVQLVKSGFKSKIGDGSMDAEGLIGRTRVPLFDATHSRLICKIKTKDF